MTRLLPLACLALLTGCLKPNPLALAAEQGELDGETDADGIADSTSETGETSDTQAPSDLPASESTSSEATSSEATSDASESTSSDSTGGDCAPPPEFEPNCGSCLSESCCTSLAPCGEDVVCVCLADCLFAGMSDNACRMLCGEKPSDVEPLAPLLACASQDCLLCYE